MSCFFFSSRRRHTRLQGDWSSDVCSSDLEIASRALEANGALIRVASLDDAVELANRLAPEHLELMVSVAAALIPRVRHAGAVFVGGHTPEVVGDYVAGPNHVLPTAGTARFASP